MKFFGFGKAKAVSFPQFVEMVRASVRGVYPTAKIKNADNGFILYIGESKPFACNLRSLYNTYTKAPKEREALIKDWMETLHVHLTDDPTKITWAEARPTLRPIPKEAEYLAAARATMLKSKDPDSLPYAPFVGELSVIVMREVSRTLTGVTQKQLDAWGVTFEIALQEALNNLNLMNFPPVSNSLRAGGASAPIVGLVYEADHMTASWIVMERFRDHLTMQLQGDYVVFVPSRGRLSAVRADEPGLIASIQQSNRNHRNLPYPLTAQVFYVAGSTTGGVVTLYQQGGRGKVELNPASPFAAGRLGMASNTPPPVPTGSELPPPSPIDLSTWGSLSESTFD